MSQEMFLDIVFGLVFVSLMLHVATSFKIQKLDEKIHRMDNDD